MVAAVQKLERPRRVKDSGSNGGGIFLNNFLLSNQTSSFTADLDGTGSVARIESGETSKNYLYRSDGRLGEYFFGNKSFKYFYDALDRLVVRKVENGSLFTQSYSYLALEENILLGKSGEGSLFRYLNGSKMSERFGEVKGGLSTAFIADHLGSILNSPLAGASKSYGLFGEMSSSVEPDMVSSPAVFGFSGHVIDTESGLSRTLFRHYDSKRGRWLSQEPFGSEGPNPYSFAFSSPQRYVDLDGLRSSDEILRDYVNLQKDVVSAATDVATGNGSCVDQVQCAKDLSKKAGDLSIEASEEDGELAKKIDRTRQDDIQNKLARAIANSCGKGFSIK